MKISGIASLHVYIQPEAVSLRIHLISFGGVLKLLKHLSWANAPSFILDTDVGRRVVVGLEEVGGFEMGREVRCDELLVLSTRLCVATVSARTREQRSIRRLTTIVPLPQRPFQCPEMKLTQLR